MTEGTMDRNMRTETFSMPVPNTHFSVPIFLSNSFSSSGHVQHWKKTPSEGEAFADRTRECGETFKPRSRSALVRCGDRFRPQALAWKPIGETRSRIIGRTSAATESAPCMAFARVADSSDKSVEPADQTNVHPPSASGTSRSCDLRRGVGYQPTVLVRKSNP